MVIVTKENLWDVLTSLPLVLSIDCETTGLKPYGCATHEPDKLFSIVVSSDTEDYYFDFNRSSPHALPYDELFLSVKEAFETTQRHWFLQNAKFDMHMLFRHGIHLAGKVYDLAVLDRLHFNQHPSYRLSDISKRHGGGEEKLDIVMKYIEENPELCQSVMVCPLTGRETNKLHFERVPFDIMSTYACQDGRVTLIAGHKLTTELYKRDPATVNIADTECKLTRTLFYMERRGVQLDMDYCKEGLSFYRDECRKHEDEFGKLTGVEFKKGTTVFEEVFSGERDKWKKTEKGNWRWDADILSAFEHPAARIAIAHAEAKKQADYFSGFLYHADRSGVLHTDFKQSGTVTGRLSSADVNLQNLTNPDKYDDDSLASKYPVRAAFVPRPGYVFVMIDYDQSEYRLFMDYCQPKALVEQILGGLDVHAATAKIANVSRKEAKQVNFLSVYGGGVAKLVAQLYQPKGSQAQVSALFKKLNGWRFRDAEEALAYDTITADMRAHDEPLIRQAYGIQQSIFKAAPEMKEMLKRMQKRAEEVGFVTNWAGRRMYFPDKRWCYKAPNHIIQGGGADMMKRALVAVDEYLTWKQSRIVLTIHDEIILEVHESELHEVPNAVRDIMQEQYPYKLLPQTAGVSWNSRNLASKEKYEAARDCVQGASSEVPASGPAGLVL